MRKEDRERTLVEVANRVFSQIVSEGDEIVETLLADALFHEKQRMEKNPSELPENQRNFWREVQEKLVEESHEKQRRLLKGAIEMYVEEIVGKLDPRVYAVSTRVLPSLFTLLLNAVSVRSVLEQVPRGSRNLKQNIIRQGNVESLGQLHRHGRIVLVPTHASHLDSVVVGWILHDLGLPPFAYGAGLNLFSNPMLSFVMHNNGAYKVDRKKRFELYKTVLKEYCTVSLEYGYDNLFFPGGTRSRSGAIEERLKLGLVGGALRAYQNNLRLKRPQPKVFIVPATLSYHLVLEAETLIDDFLQEVGKSRYIIEDDEATQPRRVYHFVKNLFSLNARIYCSFGKPLDPFGNDVDDEGISRDPRGRPIDTSKYVTEGGELKADLQRDQEYTRLLGERIVERLHEENIVLATQLLATVLWEMLQEANPGMSLYRLLRSGGSQVGLRQEEVLARIDRFKETLIRLESAKKIRMDPTLRFMSANGILEQGLLHFSSYHTRPVAERKGERIFPGDLNLLFFYRNRLKGYRLLWAPSATYVF